MEIVRADCLMVFGIKVFRKIVSKVFFSRLPCNDKVVLGDLVGHPEEVLFHSSRGLFLDCVVGNSSGSAVVTMHWCGRLVMSQFFEREVKDGCILTL